MGVGRIPWDRIVLYAEIHGLDTEMTRALTEIVCEVDEAYRDWIAKEHKADVRK